MSKHPSIARSHTNSTGGASRPSRLAKHAFDFIVSFLAIIFFTPAYTLIAILIKRDSSGPVIYRGVRVGQHGRNFNILKFRTMYEDSEENKGPRITARDDPRITALGRRLRDTKLNELPQLWNVLKGEMSLVGPRPEDPVIAAQWPEEMRNEVLSVRPGITSLATILYAGEERMLRYSDVIENYVRSILPEKLSLDLLYVRNRSLMLDLDILIETLRVLLPRLRRATPNVEDIFLGPARKAMRHMSWFTIDCSIAFLAVGAAGVVWRSAGPLDIGVGRSLVAALAMSALFSIINWLTGIQRVQWRYAGQAEVLDVVGAASIATVILLLANSRIRPPQLPTGMLILAGAFAMSGFLTTRYHRRIIVGMRHRLQDFRAPATSGRERVLIIGCGEIGQLLIKQMHESPMARTLDVIGIVDDDPKKLGTLVHRVPVMGVCDRIPQIVRQHEIATIVFTITNIDETRRQQLLARCRETPARTLVAPDPLSFLYERASAADRSHEFIEGAVDRSHATPQFDVIPTHLRHQIHTLEQMARKGDFDGVLRSLGQLDQELQVSDSADELSLPWRKETGSGPHGGISSIDQP